MHTQNFGNRCQNTVFTFSAACATIFYVTAFLCTQHHFDELKNGMLVFESDAHEGESEFGTPETDAIMIGIMIR